MKRARHGGDEQDAFSRRYKNFLKWRPGERKRIKRRANRRDRRNAQRGLRAGYVIYDEVADWAELHAQPLTPWQRDLLAWVYRDTDSLRDLQAGGNEHD